MSPSPLQINWRTFPRDFPQTALLIGFNLLLFTLGKLNLIAPLVSVPGQFNIGTFGAHFFHFDLWHLVSNLIILLFVGRVLEPKMGKLLLPLTCLIWLGTILILWLFNNHPVLGFSGIAMGLLTFAMLLCRREPQWYSLLWPMVVINLLFGLMPGISWWGHLGGAIAGGSIYGLYSLFKTK